MMIISMVSMILFYGGMNFYIIKRIYPIINIFEKDIYSKIFLGIYILLAVSLIFRFVLMSLEVNSKIKNIVNVISSYWMGIFVYLLLFLVIADLLIFLGIAIKIIPISIIKQIRIYTSLSVIIISIILNLIGGFNANQVKETFYNITTSRTIKENGIKITLISDLHLGAVNSEKRLEEIIEKINSQESDVLLITGDIFDSDYNSIQNPSRAIELLKSIKTKYGVFACFGNHDAGKTFDKMEAFIEASNIKVLNDEVVKIDGKFILLGRLDGQPMGSQGGLVRTDINNINIPNDNNLPVIVMDHNPLNISEYNNDFDLILSGHTHKGQIWPANIVINNMYEVDYGYYRKDSNSPQVIVTSGVGTWGMPMRIGSRCEIVTINIK